MYKLKTQKLNNLFATTDFHTVFKCQFVLMCVYSFFFKRERKKNTRQTTYNDDNDTQTIHLVQPHTISLTLV